MGLAYGVYRNEMGQDSLVPIQTDSNGNLITSPASQGGTSSGLATETTLQSISSSLGSDGVSPPSTTGSGIRGWLRGVYEKLSGTLSVNSTILNNGYPYDISAPTYTIQNDSPPIGISFTSSGAELIQDMSGYNSASINFSAFPAGNIVTFYGSEDGLTNKVILGAESTGSLSGNGNLSAVSSTGAWVIPKRSRYLHIAVTTFVAGSVITGQIALLSVDAPQRAALVHGAVAAGTSVSGYPVPVGGTVRTSDTSRSVGQRAEAQFSPESNLFVQQAAGAYGGASTFRVNTSVSGVIKSSGAGTFYGLHAYNSQSTPRFLQLYNKASAPTLASDTPVVTIPIKGSSDLHISDFIAFSTGVAFAITTDHAGLTSAGAGDVACTVAYK